MKRPLAVEPSPAFWSFAVLAGALLPVRFIARRYLPRRPALWGFDPFQLPPACLRELADWTLEGVKMHQRLWLRPSLRAELADDLDDTAAKIINVVKGKPALGPFDKPDREEDEIMHEPIRQILARHGVSFPEIDWPE